MSSREAAEGAALIERSGPHAGRRHVLGPGGQLIGRGGGVAVDLAGRDVSRHHARVEVSPDSVLVEDLGSKNGVLVHGRAITGSVKLGHGDRFEVGGIELEIDHPAALAGRVLAAGGETTMTRVAFEAAAEPRRPGLLLPLLGVLVFGLIAAALLVWG
jgi:S-DNA-T family DNA segregation ATPase FtsK/SpoIIIE